MRPLPLFFLLLAFTSVAGVVLYRQAAPMFATDPPAVAADASRVPLLEAEVTRLKAELEKKSADAVAAAAPLALPPDKEPFSLIGLARLVEMSRGLSFKRPPAMVPADREQIHRLHAAAVARLVSREAAEWRVRVLEALGFRWQPRHPLDEALTGLIEEQWAGFYDEEKNTLFVEAGADYAQRPDLRAKLMLDLTRILLGQHFDAARVPFGFDDAECAAAVLPIGDALGTQVACQFADRLWLNLTPAAVPEQAPFFATPAWFKEWERIPEALGVTYLEALQRREPNSTADSAYGMPPRSTAAVIHAEAEGHDAVPPPVALSLPPAMLDGKVAESAGVLGEIGVRLLLKSQLKREEIDAAATGWRGDRYSAYRGTEPAADAAVWLSEWRSPNDAAEFAGALATTLLGQYAIPESDAFHRPGGHFVAAGNGRFFHIQCLPDDRRVLLLASGSAEARDSLFQAFADRQGR